MSKRKKRFSLTAEAAPLNVVTHRPAPRAYGEGATTVMTFVRSFTGEKNLGEMGPAQRYYIDHAALRIRSWQMYLESEIIQTVFKKWQLWVVGSGLKCNAEPNREVLTSEGIELGESKGFGKTTEDRFRTYAESKIGDYLCEMSLHERAAEALMNSAVAGDVLVVLRVDKGVVTLQLIDGAHVGTPGVTISGREYVAPNGNRVRSGVEIDAAGRTVAYHVAKADSNAILPEYYRVEAYGKKTGLRMAYLVRALKYRLDNGRGIPLISAVMETAKKLERYKEATLGSAEERQKVVYAIENAVNGDTESPFLKGMARAFGGDTPKTEEGENLGDTVRATYNKQVIELNAGQSMKALESKNELYFEQFMKTNTNLICATIGIPPDVAFDKYDSNYSASRAAIKAWEHTLNVERKRFAQQFYQPIYELWLYVEVLQNKIDAPGYLKAAFAGNRMALQAYHNVYWSGANVPHIDPLKEVQAERAKLGPNLAGAPLTTLEAAAAALNGGNSDEILRQAGKEIDLAKGYNIDPGAQEGQASEKETADE